MQNMHLPMNLLKIKALLVFLSTLNKSLAVINSMLYTPLAFTAATSLGTHAQLLINTYVYSMETFTLKMKAWIHAACY